jgi:hypothetical protein
MATLEVPPFEKKGDRWPTLGPQVCDLLEERAVFGPGDRRGDPYVVDDEVRALLYRMYEIYPRGHALAGQRRFKRVAISMRKGTRKTELAALVAFAELHPEGPVRSDGWRKVAGEWEPVGRPVRDPFIPMIAYTEEQTEELAYGALYAIVTECDDVGLFDPGLDRILRFGGDGTAVALAGAPNARDGARTTFQHFDETHRLMLARLLAAHQTMLSNIPKRPESDPWSLETSVAPAPGEGSVGEKTWQYAQAVKRGKVRDSRLFFFHRQASKPLAEVIDNDKALKEWIVEASGPVVARWSDVGGIIALLRDPTSDRAYVERMWGNRPVQPSDKAFDIEAWLAKAERDFTPAASSLIVAGFDGARVDDAASLVATHVVSGFQWPIGIWEKPLGDDEWEVPEDEVDEALEQLFETYEVWRLYADPPYWRDSIKAWQGLYGEKVVIEWWTNRRKPMAYALRNYAQAIRSPQSPLRHDGNEQMAEHIGNAFRRQLIMRDEQSGERLWIIGKERPDSPDKIDTAMAGCLSWEARGDAIAAGAKPKSQYRAAGFR